MKSPGFSVCEGWCIYITMANLTRKSEKRKNKRSPVKHLQCHNSSPCGVSMSGIALSKSSTWSVCSFSELSFSTVPCSPETKNNSLWFFSPTCALADCVLMPWAVQIWIDLDWTLGIYWLGSRSLSREPFSKSVFQIQKTELVFCLRPDVLGIQLQIGSL